MARAAAHEAMIHRAAAARVRQLALGVIFLVLLALVIRRLPRLAFRDRPPSVRHLHVYCFVSGGLHLGNHSCPNMQALYLRSFVGTAAADALEWTYHPVDSEAFLRHGNRGPLKDVPAGSLIVAHSAPAHLVASACMCGGCRWCVGRHAALMLLPAPMR